MRRPLITAAGLCVAAWLAAPPGVTGDDGYRAGGSCCDAANCQTCLPTCQATWEEKKSSKPTYSMTCEYACGRAADSWHAPPPECRCCPPCGEVFVKKRAYKTSGAEQVERIPKYEVQIVNGSPCNCDRCQSRQPACWWNPVTYFRAASWW
jgi:hypothetical protein